MESAYFLCECKLTEKKSYTLTKELLEKVRREGAKQLKHGIIELSIEGRTVYVVPPELVMHYLALRQEEDYGK